MSPEVIGMLTGPTVPPLSYSCQPLRSIVVSGQSPDCQLDATLIQGEIPS